MIASRIWRRLNQVQSIDLPSCRAQADPDKDVLNQADPDEDVLKHDNPERSNPDNASPSSELKGSSETINSEQGSAIAEFVLIATPLFIPALLFFNAMQSVAKEEANISHLARQAVRVFVTAEDHHLGHQRVRFLLDEFSNIENRGQGSSSRRYGFTYNITCSAESCLTPGALVELELFRVVKEINGLQAVNGDEVAKNRKASALARSYVDKWRES